MISADEQRFIDVTNREPFSYFFPPVNREALDTWCERGILGAVLAILVYGPLATGAVRTPDFLVLQGLSLLVLLLWTVRLWLKSKPQLLWPPICWAVVAFAAYAVIRYFNSDLEYVARKECGEVLLYAFLFFAILNNLHRQEHTQLIGYTLVFLGMMIAAYAIYQFATGSDKVWTFTTPYKKRGTGTYISPNNLAGFLGMVLPLGLAMVLVSRAKPLMKVFVGYACLVILGGLAISLSRGSWIAVGVVLAALFWVLLFHRSYRLPAAVMLVFFLIAGAVLLPKAQFLKKRVQEITAHEHLHDSARFDLWEPAVRLWKENPWWGIGPNHYNYRFREFRPQVIQQQPDRAHNDYLNTLTDWGVMGLAIVLSAVALLFLGVRQTWSNVRGTSADLGGGNSNKFALVLGASLSILAVLVHSFLDFNMHIPANAIIAVTLMALLSSTLRFATSDYWFSLRLPAKGLVTIVIAAGIGILGWHEIRTAREYHWLHTAKQQPMRSMKRIEALERAFEIEPHNFETAFAIGETFRMRSWEGDDGYEAEAQRAMEWFQRSIKLNPFDGYGCLRYGMCLDWLGKTAESWNYYDKAILLDPNGYFTAAYVGWHYVQAGDFAAARTWFERSRRLEWNNNPVADTYLPIVNARLLRNASGPEAGR